MMRAVRWLVGLSALLAVVACSTESRSSGPRTRLVYVLDDHALRAALIDREAAALGERLRDQALDVRIERRDEVGVRVYPVDPYQRDRVAAAIRDAPGQLEAQTCPYDVPAICLGLAPGAFGAAERDAYDRLEQLVERRLKKLGVGKRDIGVKDGMLVIFAPPNRAARVKRLLGRAGVLAFHLVDDGHETMRRIAERAKTDPEATRRGVQSEVDSWQDYDTGQPHHDFYLKARERSAVEEWVATLPPEEKPDGAHRLAFETVRDATVRTYYLHARVEIGGDAIAEVSVQRNDQSGQHEVMVVFDSAGARRFADLTARSVGRKLAIVLDGRIESAPVITGAITGGKAVITMGTAVAGDAEEEARELAEILRAGALPAPLRLLDI